MPMAAGMYYFSYPRGDAESDAVILIHGAGGTHLHWPPEIRRLPGWNIHALDLPGHGKSGGPGEQTIEAYASKVTEWMQAIDLQRAVFAGHSMGAAIAMTMALHQPSRVRALILIGGGVRMKVHPDLLANSASENTFHLAVETATSWSFSRMVDPRLVELAAHRMAETRPPVLHGDFLACDGFDIMEEIVHIRSRTLILCGDEDRMTPLRYSLFLAGKIPDAKLVTFPEAGHNVMLEQPKAVAAALAEFLDSLI